MVAFMAALIWFNSDDDDDVDDDANSDIGGDLAMVTADRLNQQDLCGEEGNSMRLVISVWTTKVKS